MKRPPLQWAGRPAASLLAALLLPGCVSLTPEAAIAPVQQAVATHLKKDLLWQRTPADEAEAQRRVAQLLAQPLDADAAVQLALLNNRGLQAQLAELGIAMADWAQARRWPNPGISLGRMRQGDEREIERGMHINLARLLAQPWLAPMQQRQFDRTRGAVAAQVLALAGDTRRAWVQAVATQESLRYAEQVMEAAQASAELAQRMADVGNFNRLQRLREQGFYAEAAMNHAKAQGQALAAREKLTRLLGLWGRAATGEAAYRLPERLPDLPAQALDRPDIEAQAMAQRLDVQGAKQAAEITASNLGLTRRTRFINVLELGLTHNTANHDPRQTGYEISFELPLFDWGQARVDRAEALYMQAVHQAAQTAISARSEVRQAYGTYRLAWDLARHHRQTLVPMAQAVSEENLLRYNGMFIGVFELLADARNQIRTVQAAIDALKDFWMAQADLDAALLGTLGALSMTDLGAAPAGAGAAPPAGH